MRETMGLTPKEMGLTSKEKSDLNEEGWEGDAAVLVGKRGEVEAARKRLETEGRAKDLETYLRIHKKEALVPADWLENVSIFDKKATEWKGHYFIEIHRSPEKGAGLYRLTYIDRQGNVAQVDIDPELVDEIREEGSYNLDTKEMEIRQELNRLGFSSPPSEEYFGRIVHSLIDTYKQELEGKREKRRGAEFDF